MGDVLTAGYAFFRNLDTVNFVHVGIDVGGTFYPFLKLFPGQVGIAPLGTNSPYARFDTLAGLLEYGILNA
jgi:hypothetical protein